MESAPNVLTWVIAVSGIAVLILIATVVAVLWWHQRRLALQAKAWGIHLLNAQEDERRRIARDLHDDVVQRLSTAQWSIERADPESATLIVAEVARDLRSLAHELYPASLQHLSLARALRDLAAHNDPEHGLAIAVDCDEQVAVPAPAMVALYRTAQEGLQNMRKHSRASSATLSLRRDGQFAELQLSDDGVGCPEPIATAASFGLRSIQERLALVGGSMRIGRPPAGTGTVLVARVPVA